MALFQVVKGLLKVHLYKKNHEFYVCVRLFEIIEIILIEF